MDLEVTLYSQFAVRLVNVCNRLLRCAAIWYKQTRTCIYGTSAHDQIAGNNHLRETQELFITRDPSSFGRTTGNRYTSFRSTANHSWQSRDYHGRANVPANQI
jgi:hypothetical protein